ncbi:MAG TPA: hypothetical protein PK858_01105 [Saprospiraceae bacterium]|nr:hypothetical protein [Saprospiraceae bacterium]
MGEADLSWPKWERTESLPDKGKLSSTHIGTYHQHLPNAVK